jgi:RND family efflux transporter MFP subunit
MDTLRSMRVSALSLCVLTSCAPEQRPTPAAPRPRTVATARAERSVQPVAVELVGSVRAVRSATLAPVVSGTVAELRVSLGSQVRAGDVLVRLSAREIDARLEQARAAETQARRERDRAAALAAQGALAPAQLDAARTELEVAAARSVEAATMAAHTVLRAPFGGVITGKLADVGDTALPGRGLLTIEAPGAVRFEARVPEGAASLALGAEVRVRVADREIVGRVAEIEPIADAATRTRLVKVDLPPAPDLHTGQFGRLLVAVGSVEAVTVPATAVVRRGQLEAVFVVDHGAARLQLVRAARERAGRVEIASGLAGDETVVAAGGDALVDGQPLEARP